MTRTLSPHAAAAKAIRADLKATYPYTKFSVRSESFAGGDAVHVEWTDGPTERDVMAITNRYEMGHFDGMIDLYEYDNVDRSIPQVKFVQTRRNYSDDTEREAVETHNAYWRAALTLDAYGRPTDPERGYLDTDTSNRLWRLQARRSLICPDCLHPVHLTDNYCGECGAAQPPIDWNAS